MDRSISLDNQFPNTGSEEKSQIRRRKTFSSIMVPLLRKSVGPLGKFLATHFNRQLANEWCRVCYAQAQVRYYGVILCHACKDFFLRAAFKQDKVSSTCCADGYCILRSFNLEMCPACRLKKCFAVGLEPCFRFLRAERILQEPIQLPTLNLLGRDVSSLAGEQWILLNNLVCSFDINRPRTLAHRFITEHTADLYPKICFKIPDYYNDLITTMYSVTHSFIDNNHDVSCLPESQRQLVHHHGYNNLAMFCGPVVARHLHLLENQGFITALDLSFGVKNRQCSEFIASKLDYDPYFIMFVMAIYIFSSSSCTSFRSKQMFTCDDDNAAMSLFRIQNVYTEVTWKYLIYRYSFEDVVRRFDNLIRCFIIAQNSLAVMQNDCQHEEILNSFINQTEQ
ncbi:hypothetical protein I4U23_027620 [Adineta vaga]|nr:hypothetical protein I4U23_027620 [Adineta vaga]